MKVTGYILREGIRRWTTRRDLAWKQFKDNLFAFDGEDKDARAMSEAYVTADTNVAILEDAQQRYNQQVLVMAGDKKYSLSLAIKMIGGAGRYEKMWRDAVTDNGQDRYSYGDSRAKRDKTSDYATKTVSDQDALALADLAAQRASALRAGIAVSNSIEVDISGLDPTMFA